MMKTGFQDCMVQVKLGISDVPSKAYKVVAIGIDISDEEIIEKIGKSSVKVNKVQRLKFKGNPTQKVVLVVEFEQEQDMKIALFNGIYFDRIHITVDVNPFSKNRINERSLSVA